MSRKAPPAYCETLTAPAGESVPAVPPTLSSRSNKRETSDTLGLIGTVLDARYHIEQAVGQGGFGVVYRARHLAFNAPVAIKILRVPSGLSAGRREEFVKSFLAEGKVLFELGSLHPAIIRAFETGSLVTPDGSIAPYLALEWLDGLSLDRELQARTEAGLQPYSMREAMSLLARAVEGVCLAHDKGIAHRDIKPGNIFLTVSDGVTYPKVLDFGLAKAMADTTSLTQMLADTAGGQTPFTAAYGAPEQWLRRLGATGPWSDVHALALVFVELLAGRRALVGDDAHQLMAACLDKTCRPTPRSLGVDVSDAVEAVMAKALAVEPRDRYPNANAFWLALCQATQWSPLSAESVAVVGDKEPLSHRPRDLRVARNESDDNARRAESGVSTTRLGFGRALTGASRSRRVWSVVTVAGIAIAVVITLVRSMSYRDQTPTTGLTVATASSPVPRIEPVSSGGGEPEPATIPTSAPTVQETRAAPSAADPGPKVVRPAAGAKAGPDAGIAAPAASLRVVAPEAPPPPPSPALPPAAVPGPKDLLNDDELTHRK